MHATHWFLPWIYCLLVDTTTFAWRSLTTGGMIIFSLVLCLKMYSLFFYTPSPHAIKYVTDKNHVVVCNRASLCVVLLARTYITCTRIQTMSICPKLHNTILAPGTQPLAMLLCGFFWGISRNHYYLLLVLVVRALVMSISMYVCTCTHRNSINKRTTMISTAQYHDFFYSKYYYSF